MSELRERQEQQRTALLENLGETTHGIMRRAWQGTASKRDAIKAKCLECTVGMRAEIRDCTSYTCPLFEYRPFRESVGHRDGASCAPESPIDPEGAPG